MKRMVKFAAVMALLMAVTVTAYANVNVTFRANSCMVQGVLDTNDVSTDGNGLTGVDLRGTVQSYAGGADWTPGDNPMVSDGGDYWSYTISFPDAAIGSSLEYKFGFTVLNLDGTITSNWESANNRPFTVPATDTVLPVDYVGDGSVPFTDNPDTMDVYLRVNMGANVDFDSKTGTVYLAGDIVTPNWSPGSVAMNQEGSSDYWNLHVECAAGSYQYKFTPGTSWDGSEESNNRSLTVNQDTTVQWVWFNDVPALGFTGQDTADITFETDLSYAVQNNGFTLGDTLLVRFGYGGSSTTVLTDTLVNEGGYDYYVIVNDIPVGFGSPLYYQYYKLDKGLEIRENYYNQDPSLDDQTLAERRSVIIESATATVSDYGTSSTDMRRMPTFRNGNVIAQDTLKVYLECDVRPAIYSVKNGVTLNDVQGDIDITPAMMEAYPDTILNLGVAVNGPITGSWGNDTGMGDWGHHIMSLDNKAMYDDGTHGDLTAGDSIFTITLYLYADSSGLNTVGQEFKFGIGGGDNEGGEGGFGNNHIENVDDSQAETRMRAEFGSINMLYYSGWDYGTNSPILTAIKTADGSVPANFALKQNFPNPFNPTTTISYSLPVMSDVTLTIYNSLGQSVATYTEAAQAAGSYDLVWNGTNNFGQQVSTGVYFYKLSAGKYSSVKKMIFMK